MQGGSPRKTVVNPFCLRYNGTMTSPAGSPWSAATAALYDAVLCRDLRAARRALFDGGDPMQARDDWPAPNSAFLLSLMGSPAGDPLEWRLDLPMLTLLLDHGADPQAALHRGRTPVFAAAHSMSHNAAQGLVLLHTYGAIITPGDFFSWMGDLETPTFPTGMGMVYAPLVVLDALWDLADDRVRATVLQSSPVLLAMAHAKTGRRWGPEGVARAQWLLRHGATQHTDLFPSIVHASPMPTVAQVTRVPAGAPEPVERAATILPFRPRPH